MNLDGLAALVAGYRRNRNLTLRDAAAESGVSSSTLSRIERAEAHPDLATVQRLVDWIGVPIDRVVPQAAARPAGGRRARTAVLDDVETRFRGDPQLSPEAAEALIRIVRTAYEQLARAARKRD